MIFASERLQSPGEEGEQRQEDGVCGCVPPQSHAQWRDALHHEFHAEVGPVEHEVERHEDEAPEQEFAFHDPHAFEVGFDGLLFVEKEPSGDGEEDDDADFTAALHHELEEDAFRSQGEFQHVIAVVDDEVVHEDHEHRDDAQQLDAGIPVRRCRSCLCSGCFRPSYFFLLVRLFPENSTGVERLREGSAPVPKIKSIHFS